ncbi:MAG: HNH endonuclease signature motif containing protein [Bdellovibrionota bacterium]
MNTFLDKKCPVRRDKKRKARVAKLHKSQETVSKTKVTRHIPAKIRDEVYVRDGGQCTFDGDGVRCDSKHDLEVHHEIPFSVCKSHEVDNLRLLCQRHNKFEAERVFGAEYVQGCIDLKKGIPN